MYTKDFTGNKPSKAQVTKAITEGLKAGHRSVAVNWGENQIEVWKGNCGTVMGWGWIRSIGGSDIAETIMNGKAV